MHKLRFGYVLPRQKLGCWSFLIIFDGKIVILPRVAGALGFAEANWEFNNRWDRSYQGLFIWGIFDGLTSASGLIHNYLNINSVYQLTVVHQLLNNYLIRIDSQQLWIDSKQLFMQYCETIFHRCGADVNQIFMSSRIIANQGFSYPVFIGEKIPMGLVKLAMFHGWILLVELPIHLLTLFRTDQMELAIDPKCIAITCPH